MPAAGPEAMAVGPTNWPLAVPYDPQAVTKRYGGAATAVLLSVNASTAKMEATNSADDRVKAIPDPTPGQHERHRRLSRFSDRGNRERNLRESRNEECTGARLQSSSSAGLGALPRVVRPSRNHRAGGPFTCLTAYEVP